MTVKATAGVLLIGAGLFSVAPPMALAQTPSTSQMVATAPGKAAAVTQTEATATVQAIDSAKREVTLKRPDGHVFSVTAPPEVRNFDQIKVGDTVHATYTMAVALELKKPGTVTPGPATTEQSMTRAPVGAAPAGTIAQKITAIADVIAVDTAKRVVTLRGPAGNEVDLDVHDPDQLKNIKKGDHVQVTYVEALAISVQPTKVAAAQ
jgi:hypothetical protein